MVHTVVTALRRYRQEDQNFKCHPWLSIKLKYTSLMRLDLCRESADLVKTW